MRALNELKHPEGSLSGGKLDRVPLHLEVPEVCKQDMSGALHFSVVKTGLQQTAKFAIKRSPQREGIPAADRKLLIQVDRELWSRAFVLLLTLAGLAFAGLANFASTAGLSST